MRKNLTITPDFSKLVVSLSSPEKILQRSYGEVTEADTINHRTHKPIDRGLFSERIFGPVKDFECACEKYKGRKYQYTVCEKCGVQVNTSKVRRERMGHIRLAVPIAHVWFFRNQPNIIGNILGIPSKKVEKVVYHLLYVVIQEGVMGESIKKGAILTPEEYNEISKKISAQNRELPDKDPDKVIIKTGGEGIYTLLKNLDLDYMSVELRRQINVATSQQKKTEAIKRLTYIEAFRKGNRVVDNRPEYMVIQVLPVIPPDLRPLMQLPNSRFAMSETTDLYRRIIIRNNRLKQFIEINAPDIILRNEKRLLQEAVDALLDNTKKNSSLSSQGGRPLKSFSDDLKGKKGLFRNNLLGKRLDYSGRSVIVVGPNLKLNECGLPKHMAVELFKPFIIKGLINRTIVKNIKEAKRFIERKEPVIWDILEKQLIAHPVLLNRPPTLHRLSIQAFQPKLVEGKAIQLHPLVCAGFNADFDGDQMAVHVPLSQKAIAEATMLMTPVDNILKPASGEPIISPTKDMTLGHYYLTKKRNSTAAEPLRGAGSYFYGIEEVVMAYNHKQIDLHTPIHLQTSYENEKGKFVREIVETTVGRALFNKLLPKKIKYVNKLITSKDMQKIIAEVHEKMGPKRTAEFLDDIKDLGFNMAYRGGLTINLSDITVPENKEEIIAKAEKEVEEIKQNYQMGFITNTERYNQVIDIWTKATVSVTNQLLYRLRTDKDGFNSIFMMMDSGARGSIEQVKQLGAMRGLIAKPKRSSDSSRSGMSVGNMIEIPIYADFLGGLSMPEYFISTRGARKGLTDTAIKTADSGYLSRKLANLGQEIIVTEKDCKTLRGFKVSVSYHLKGRVALEDILDPVTGKRIVKANELITQKNVEAIRSSEHNVITIRSVFTCATKYGVCAKCYGISFTNNQLVQIGESIGIIAAQSIGEPGTQLTLRTFHVGGAVGGAGQDPKVKASHTARVDIDNLHAVSKKEENGKESKLVIGKTVELTLTNPTTNKEVANYHIPYGAHLFVKKGQHVKKGDLLYTFDPYNLVILAGISGKLRYQDVIEGVTYKEELDPNTGYKERTVILSKNKKYSPSLLVENEKEKVVYNIPANARLIKNDGESITAGTVLCKIPRLSQKRSDITGGLPLVTEVFEVRNPSNAGVSADFDGIVTYGAIKRGNREIVITAKEGTTKKYMIPVSKHILVQDGDYVKCGTLLSEGVTSIVDILRVNGIEKAVQYIIQELQGVYTLQGVQINSKHIEVILRAMMKSVHIIHPGDTLFVTEQIVNKHEFDEVNEAIINKKIVTSVGESDFKVGQLLSQSEEEEERARLIKAGKATFEVRSAKAAVGSTKIQGITRSSVNTESFISASSFQETNKVLSQAAVAGKVDHLRGLKENVIAGRLIPVGTGLKSYQNMFVKLKHEENDNK